MVHFPPPLDTSRHVTISSSSLFGVTAIVSHDRHRGQRQRLLLLTFEIATKQEPQIRTEKVSSFPSLPQHGNIGNEILVFSSKHTAHCINGGCCSSILSSFVFLSTKRIMIYSNDEEP